MPEHAGSRGIISTDALSKPRHQLPADGHRASRPIDAYDGYLGTGGRLITDTSPACTALGRPLGGRCAPVRQVNDDLLSCFLKNNTPASSATRSATRGTDPLFTQDIWKSPRFVLVPVLDHDPNGTKWMPIIDFVPGFICDQPSGASKQAPLPGTQTENGLVTQNPQKLRAIRVFFFDMDALPPPPDGTPLQDYFGIGQEGRHAGQLTAVPGPTFRPQHRLRARLSTGADAGRLPLSASSPRLLREEAAMDGNSRDGTDHTKQGLGHYGETLAARHLTGAGMVLLERNWRTTTGEIDLLLREGDVLVVCEVKTRTSDACGLPHEAVDQAKVDRLRRVADEWLAGHAADPRDVRVDLVAVTRPRKGPSVVEHVRGIG